MLGVMVLKPKEYVSRVSVYRYDYETHKIKSNSNHAESEPGTFSYVAELAGFIHNMFPT